MKLVYLLGICILLYSCSQNQGKIITITQKGDTIIKGDVNNVSGYNDTILYFTLDNKLIKRSFYKNGKQEGQNVEYYPNGHLKSIMYYSNGLKNGYTSSYDSSQKKNYSGFYYYGLPVGSIVYFDGNELPKNYYFLNLQNETLLHISYKDWKGVDDIIKNCIYYTCNVQTVDTTKQLSVLLYLIYPPRLSFEYSIVKNKKESDSNFFEYKKIDSKAPFIIFTLPMSKSDEKYSIGLNVYDSILNKKMIIYKEIYISE